MRGVFESQARTPAGAANAGCAAALGQGIAVEKVLPAEARHAYPIRGDGERHGPPEDCGGVPGFYNLPERIGGLDRDQHEEVRDWPGDDFDPESFPVDEVNRRAGALATAPDQG